jgi:hypothetical protein
MPLFEYLLLKFGFRALPFFTAAAKNYLDEDQLGDLQEYIAKTPDRGDLIPGTGGVRKLRYAYDALGKRGGLRVIYYVREREGHIWLIAIYGKNARENMKSSTLEAVRRAIDDEYTRTGKLGERARP